MAASSSRHHPRFDAYVADAAPFARPILVHLCAVVHAACPEVEETIRWSRPFFDYRGSTLCMMSALEAHCGFGFWRGREMEGLPQQERGEGIGQFGRIGSNEDLPSKRALTAFIKAAMKLAEADTKPVPKIEAAMPDDLELAFASTPGAVKHFDAFSPRAKREYLEWIVEARRAETRAARIATMMEWSAEGKTRHWKYQK